MQLFDARDAEWSSTWIGLVIHLSRVPKPPNMLRGNGDQLKNVSPNLSLVFFFAWLPRGPLVTFRNIELCM